MHKAYASSDTVYSSKIPRTRGVGARVENNMDNNHADPDMRI